MNVVRDKPPKFCNSCGHWFDSSEMGVECETCYFNACDLCVIRYGYRDDNPDRCEFCTNNIPKPDSLYRQPGRVQVEVL